ncbi:MAG: hypothetical protein H0U74_05185 [Bradymonadaceae bacterium]|nr:hypothetical protein [Lujinxingiaceae bacterium]
MSWTPYHADDYVDFNYVENFCRALAAEHPEWVELTVVGESGRGRPLLLLTLSAKDLGADGSRRGERPALWLDAGTHASEFTGVSAVLFAISTWMERLLDADAALARWFSTHEVVAMPCISPDGVQAMYEGAPFVRSSLSPSVGGQVRGGLDACDIDGDGAVRMMRWKHPAGAFVEDETWAPFMRPRTLDDDAKDAFFLCDEGTFVNWDGVRWTSAAREFGVDLNRNFPGGWEPFSMFGMHGGRFPLSEPESRAVVDAFAAHPRLACALTMHTYTGCILTQPYRKDSPLSKGDIDLMEQLAVDVAEGTGYRVVRVFPDFMYDKERAIVGVWADTISTVFGVPGFTVELWDPIGYAAIEVQSPIDFLMRPPPEQLRQFLRKFAEDADNVVAWRPFEHPQLGPVEIGGIEYLRTIRNPPTKLLADECAKAFKMAERARQALPEVQANLATTPLGDGVHRVRLTLENLGFLPTSGLERGSTIGASPPVWARLHLSAGLVCDHPLERQLDHLDGWGNVRTGSARNAVYAGLPARGHRQFVEWTVHGKGRLEIRWNAGRAGCNTIVIEL